MTRNTLWLIIQRRYHCSIGNLSFPKKLGLKRQSTGSSLEESGDRAKQPRSTYSTFWEHYSFPSVENQSKRDRVVTSSAAISSLLLPKAPLQRGFADLRAKSAKPHQASVLARSSNPDLAR